MLFDKQQNRTGLGVNAKQWFGVLDFKRCKQRYLEILSQLAKKNKQKNTNVVYDSGVESNKGRQLNLSAGANLSSETLGACMNY